MSAPSLQERFEIARKYPGATPEWHIPETYAYLKDVLNIPNAICGVITDYVHQFPMGTVGYILEEGAQKTQKATEELFWKHDGGEAGASSLFCRSLHTSQILSLYSPKDNRAFLIGVACNAFSLSRGRLIMAQLGRSPHDAKPELLPAPLRAFPFVLTLEDIVFSQYSSSGTINTYDVFLKFAKLHSLPDSREGNPAPEEGSSANRDWVTKACKEAEAAYPLAGGKSFEMLRQNHFHPSDPYGRPLPGKHGNVHFFLKRIFALHAQHNTQQQPKQLQTPTTTK